MRRGLATSIFVLSLFAGAAQAADTIKIGYIDPLSGGGASVGEVGLKHFQWLADQINAKGGVNGKKIEIIPLDNKTNPQESLVQAQKAIDQGAHFITQGNGSSVGCGADGFRGQEQRSQSGQAGSLSELRGCRSRSSRTRSATTGISAGTPIPTSRCRR